MTSRPRSSARAITSGVTPWARMTTAAPLVDVIERVDGADALGLELGDDALVVHDLAERVRLLALRGGEARVVDRLAHAVAEPGPARDPDLFDGTHSQAKYGTGRVRAAGSRPVCGRAAAGLRYELWPDVCTA